MTASRRVAVIGGTFDPVHVGHVSVLEQVMELLNADDGLLVPSAQPPHRPPATASAEQRLEMTRAAVHGRPHLCVDDLEVLRGGPSYTFDTLTEWQRRSPKDEFHIILGADAARIMPRWHRAEELLALGHFVVINRSGIDRVDVPEARELGFPQERTRLLQVVSPDVSATAIRSRIAVGEAVTDLVDPGVLAIIERDHLYNESA